jgi:hypothetical protein
MEDNKKDHPEGCKCLMCKSNEWSKCHGWKFHFLRGLFMALILGLVFWLGVKAGEFKGGRYGMAWGRTPRMYRMMKGSEWKNQGFYGPGMMSGGKWQQGSATSTQVQ